MSLVSVMIESTYKFLLGNEKYSLAQCFREAEILTAPYDC